MQRRKRVQAQVGAVLRGAAARVGRMGISAAEQMLQRIGKSEDGGNVASSGQRVAEAVSKGAEQLIARSPVPIPTPVREALERMGQGLGQLSHTIDTLNAGASSLVQEAKPSDESRRQHAMEDAKAAFSAMEATGAETAPAKKSRRHRSRRGSRHSDDRQNAAPQDAQRDDSPPAGQS